MSKVIIEDSKISMIWEGANDEISIDPTFYQDNGTPVDCETGEDMEYVRTEVELSELIVVTVIENNVVQRMFNFTNNEKAEDKFKELIKQFIDYEMTEEDMEICLDDGFAENELFPVTVCISHPE